MKIPLSNPDITEKEKEAIMQVIDSPNLSLGPKLNEFEERFTDYIGSKYAIAVNSGTSGLHLCIRALDIKDEDRVLISPFGFIASANCILFERAKPVFVDIDEETLNIDINKLEDEIKKLRIKSKRFKAVLPVHIFGRPCEMDEIMELAERYELQVIEDACEAVGAKYLINSPELKTQNLNVKMNKESREKSEQRTGINCKEKEEPNRIWKKAGTFGRCGVFAFYPNKQITTGEGGMIVTDDENTARLCRSMRNQGRAENGGWLQHERLGYNYRISDINCALGIAQLERIDEILIKRENVARLYNKKLAEINELILPQFEKNKKVSWFVYVIRLSNEFSQEDRDLILSRLKEKGIGCSNYFSPIHLQHFYRKMFGYKKGDFSITERVSERTIALPFYNNLRDEQINFVSKSLKNIIDEVK